jgi:hypothetical protein
MTHWNQHTLSGRDLFAMSIGSVLLWAVLLTFAVPRTDGSRLTEH